MYINYIERLGENGKGLSTGFINPNDVPKAIKDDDPDLGVTWDWKPVNRFYAQKIKEISEKFTTTQTTSTPKAETKLPPQSASQAFEPASTTKKEDFTDLPF